MQAGPDPEVRGYRGFGPLMTSPLFHAHWCQGAYSKNIPPTISAHTNADATTIQETS